MALAKCLECGKQVSRSAKACPNCGKPDPTVSDLAKQKKDYNIWNYIEIL